jgi:hypothetical protein
MALLADAMVGAVSTRAKGNAAPAWVAAYLAPWWPDAEKTPNGRPGRDLENTPGVAWEVKTGAEWRPKAWTRQAEGYPVRGELGVLLYLPPGFGERSVGESLCIVRTRLLMPVLVEAGYAPPPRPPECG